jgi:hypothetical protein
LVDAVLLNHTWLYDVVRSGAERGNSGFQDYWHQVGERVNRTHRWHELNHQTVVEALTSLCSSVL